MGFETESTRGVLVHYGPRSTDQSYGAENAGGGKVKSLTYKWSYDALPGGSADNLKLYIPAGAQVVDAYIKATTAFAGGTSYDIGLEQSDGSTAIDADGLWDAIVLADLDATSGSVASEHGGTNSGAIIGTSLANDAYLVAAATGTFTAGVAELTIEYIE